MIGVTKLLGILRRLFGKPGVKKPPQQPQPVWGLTGYDEEKYHTAPYVDPLPVVTKPEVKK